MTVKTLSATGLLFLILIALNQAWAAACSPYIGLATLNEVHRINGSDSADSPEDFVEVRRLNQNVSDARFRSWSIKICSAGKGCKPQGLDQTGSPSGSDWLTLSGEPFPSSYIDFDNGFHVELLDENDALIDILIHRSGSYAPATATGAGYNSCDFSYDIDSQTASGGGQRQLFRNPEGIGQWQAARGNSTTPTDSETNNDPSAPTLTISDAFAAAGSDAFVLLELSEPLDRNLTITLQTRDGTAIAGDDYAALGTGTTLTLPEGDTQADISIQVLETATDGRFFTVELVDLSEPVNIADNSGQVNISSVDMCSILTNNAGPLIYARDQLSFSNAPYVSVTASGTRRQRLMSDSDNLSKGGLNGDTSTTELTYIVPQTLPQSFPSFSGGNTDSGTDFDPGTYSTLAATGAGSTAQFSPGSYYIEQLSADSGMTLELSAGDYFISEAQLENVTVRAVEAGVNLHIGTGFSMLGSTLESNSSYPGDISVYVHSGAELNIMTGTQIQALIYGYKNTDTVSTVNILNNTTLEGVVVSEGRVILTGTGGGTSVSDTINISYSSFAYEAFKRKFSCPSPLPAPYIEYRFDELQWDGETGEVTDSSDFGRNGTADTTFGTTTTDDNVICRAADLSVGNRYIRTPALDPLESTATISFWIKTTQAGNSSVLLAPALSGTRETADKDGVFWGWINDAGQIGFSIGNSKAVLSDRSINNDTYRHVAISYNSGSRQARIYIDGVRESVGTTGNGKILTVIDQLGFAKRADGSVAPFLDALVDEFLLFDTVLTETQIAQIYSLQSQGKNLNGTERECLSGRGPFAQYLMNETGWDGTGSVTDSSGLYNADPIGLADTQSYTSTCFAGGFGMATSDGAASVNGVDTGIDVRTDIGNQGSLLLWVRAEENFAEFSGARNLFDASTASQAFWAGVNSSGQIQFVLTDDSGAQHQLSTDPQNHTRADWIQLAFRWDTGAGYMTVSANGTEISRLDAIPDGRNLSGTSELMFGDSAGLRTNGPGDAWWGQMADARIYNVALTDTEIVSAMLEFTPCIAELDHFTVSHDGNGINCLAEPVTFQARLSNGQTYDRYTGSVSLSTSAMQGDWQYSGSNAFTPVGDYTGQADVSYGLNDRGEITLNLVYLDAGGISINVDDGGIDEQAGEATADDDPLLTFAEAGFIVTDAPGNPQLTATDMVARTTSANLYLRAITTDPETGVCEPLFNGPVDIEMGTQCVNPGTCAAGQNVNFISPASSTTAAPLPANNVSSDDSGFSWQSEALDFGAESTASFRVRTDDVGLQTHSFRYRLTSTDGTTSDMNTSIQYYARPDNIRITSRQNPDDEELSPGLNNTVIAGDNITITIGAADATGSAYQSFNRIDYDPGTPETDPYPIIWSSTLLQPADGVDGILSNGTDWVAEGDGLTTSLQYSEIEQIALEGQLADFWNGASSVYSYTLPAVNIATLVPGYLTIDSLTQASWESPFDGFYQGAPSSLIGLSAELRAFNAGNVEIWNFDNTSPSFLTPTNALLKAPVNSATGGPLTSELSWVIDDMTDDNLLSVDAVFSDVIWQRTLPAPDSNDLPATVSEFQLAAQALRISDALCVKSAHTAPCSTADLTLPITADRTLTYARLRVPDQVDAISTEANIPLTLESLSAFSNGEPVFEVESDENSLGFSPSEIAGLEYRTGGVCTLAQCPTPGNLLPVSVSNLDDADTELSAGKGFMTYELGTPDQGILETHLQLPAWLYWEWANDGVQVTASTLLLFGDYQGRSPILYTRPGFR